MRFKILCLVLLVCIVPALAQESTPEATASDCNAMPAPDHREVLDILLYGDGVLDIQAWHIFFVEDKIQQASLAWESETSVALVKHWVYACGAPDLTQTLATLDQAYYDVVMAQYAPYERTATCRRTGVTLIEFIGINNGVPYKMRIWYEVLDDYRFREVRLNMPRTQETQFEELSAAFYPKLPTCGKSQ
jgi:hypothetical protein